MCYSTDVTRQADDANGIGVPGPHSQLLGESELRIYFRYFVRIILVIFCPLLDVNFPCHISVPRLHSFSFLDYSYWSNDYRRYRLYHTDNIAYHICYS